MFQADVRGMLNTETFTREKTNKKKKRKINLSLITTQISPENESRLFSSPLKSLKAHVMDSAAERLSGSEKEKKQTPADHWEKYLGNCQFGLCCVCKT